jgi:hypothetical protein
VWQALHAELEPLGVTVVTVALDFDPAKAKPWIEAAAPTHPALVDTDHMVDRVFGISNVPMAVWIDEAGVLVRPAESASIQSSPYAAIELTDDMAEGMRAVLSELRRLPDLGPAYRDAIVDWANHGEDSEFALTPDQVIELSQPRARDHSRAAALFELGHHHYDAGNKAAAIPLWKQAHELFPENWTYKRQAWTLESTPEGGASDQAQEVHEVYGTSWSQAFLNTGAESYTVQPRL